MSILPFTMDAVSLKTAHIRECVNLMDIFSGENELPPGYCMQHPRLCLSLLYVSLTGRTDRQN